MNISLLADSPHNAHRDRLVLFGSAAIFVTALYFRAHGVDFGLPDYRHPDEAAYLPNAIRILSSDSLNPRYFNNPPFFTYLLATLIKSLYWFSTATGSEYSLKDFIATNKVSLLIYARLIIGIFGAATCVVVYRIGLKLKDSFTGFASALFIALCFLHARDSHYAVNDVLMTFFVSCSFIGCISIWQGSGLKTYIWTGLFIGLSVATKYNAGIVVAPLIVSYVLRPKLIRTDTRSGLFIALLSAFLAFTIICPWYFLDANAFFKGFFNQLRMGKIIWYGQSEELAVVFYVKSMLWGYGFIPILTALIGAVSVIRSSKQQATLLLSFPVLYICSILFSKMFFVRFMIPILPFLAVLSGIGISAVLNSTAKRWRSQLSQLVTVSVLVLAYLQGTIFLVRHNSLITTEDSRIAASHWINKHVSKGSIVLYTPYSPKIDKYDFREAILGRRQKLEELKNMGKAHAVVSSYYRCRNLLYPNKFPELDQSFLYIERHGTLLYETSDTDVSTRCFENFALDNIYSPFWNLFSTEILGPEIKIYRFN